MIESLLFMCITMGTRSIYHLKLVINSVIFSLLSYIVASGIVGDNTPLKKAYLSLSIVIIICLSIDKYVRTISVYFDFMYTINSPINLAIGMKKVINYKKIWHLAIICLLLLLEDIKILCAIFCIIDLNYTINQGVFVVYWVYALILLESCLGLILYFSGFVLVATKKDFYMRWCKWMCRWYVSDIVRTFIYKIDDNIYMEWQDLHPGSTPPSP